jgi:hypothetical protein
MLALQEAIWSGSTTRKDVPARDRMHGHKPEIEPALRRNGTPRVSTLALLLLLATTALAIPVVTHALPPLTDYINNLARAHAVSAIGSDPDLQRFYQIEWRILPNLMIDLAVPVLNRFMTVYVAGQVFTIAAFFLILSGTLAVNRALFGRWSALPLLASVLVYNEVLLVGVMNYVFGVGLALWGFAAWIALRDRAWPWRFAVSTVFVFALFICHLYALGVYGLGLLAFESHRLWQRRRVPPAARLLEFVATGAPFLLALALLLRSPTWSLAAGTFWHFEGKLDGLLFVFTVYHHAVAYVIIALMAAGIVWAAVRGMLHVHPVGWFLLGFGAALYLAMPRAVFATHMADQRLPVAVAFLLIACLDLDLRRRRLRQAFAIAVVALLAIRLAEVQLAWNAVSPALADFRRTVLAMPRGARVLVVHGDRDAYNDESGTVSDFGLVHAASLATIERSALVSTNFTVVGKHILHVRPAYRNFVEANDNIPPAAGWLARAAGPPDESDRFFWSQWPRKFDYVYFLFARAGDGNPDPRYLELAGQGAGFRLYRVIRKD